MFGDRSQGVQLATLQELARYWAEEYDWRRCETRLNALPQYLTGIDGVDVHFVHVRSPHQEALPLIMTHGWPGSVVEPLETVGPLTDPTRHGGRAVDAFHLVLPSLPGYAFSAPPGELGWHSGRVAQAWGQLMGRIGYTRYVTKGGDQGAAVTDEMGHQTPPGLLGIHLSSLPRRSARRQPLPRPHPRQHHAVLADRYRRLCRPLVLGRRSSGRRGQPCAATGFAPGRLHHLPR